jgi:hypothetical protein
MVGSCVTVVDASSSYCSSSDTTRAEVEQGKPARISKISVSVATPLFLQVSPHTGRNPAYLCCASTEKRKRRLDVFRNGLGCAMITLRLGRRWEPLSQPVALLKGSADS